MRAILTLIVGALSLATGAVDLRAGEEEKTPPSPIVLVRSSGKEEKRSGRLILSNGKVYTGLIYTTPGKRLKIYDRKKKKVVEIGMQKVMKIEAIPEVEKVEPIWRWEEAASDVKVYTEEFYPWRKLVTTLYLKDKKSIAGDLSAPIYVLKEGEKKPKRFILHKRQKGGIGKTLKELVYVRKIEFGEFTSEKEKEPEVEEKQGESPPETETQVKSEQAKD